MTPEQFARLITRRLKNDFDLVVAITGETGSGKSTLAIILAMLQTNNFDLEKNVCYLPEEKEIVTGFFKVNKYSTFVIDEAIQAFYKMQFYDKLQQTITKMYMTERHQNKCTLLLIPYFSDLTASFRKHKVKFWIHVLKRGHAVVFMRDEDKDIDDPWHTKDNLKKKKGLYGSKIYEREVDDILAVERETNNYFDELVFDDLAITNPDVWQKYLELKLKAREGMLQSTVKGMGNDDTISKRVDRLNTALSMAVKYMIEKEPELTQLQIGKRLGMSQKWVCNSIKYKPKYAK